MTLINSIMSGHPMKLSLELQLSAIPSVGAILHLSVLHFMS